MNLLARWWVWLRRINHCRGFGIQSPADYAFVRYVINEHWPYYKYDELGAGDDWLRRKLGQLYFRLANRYQPSVIVSNDYQDYFQAGCHRAQVCSDAESKEFVRMSVEGDYQSALSYIYNKVNQQSVLIIEGIWRDPVFWHNVEADERTVVTFDLYYCGIVMFDRKRDKHHYIINF